MGHLIEEANIDSIFGRLSAEQFYQKHGVRHEERFFENQRGMRVFTQSWVPVAREVKGVVMVVHGFTSDSSWFVQLTAVGIAKRGFSVFGIDHQGHGRTDGLKGYVPDINSVVDDCIVFFDSVREKHSHLPAFMYGESLGGAICLLVHLKQPNVWNGAVLNGAMCGISQKFKPPWPMEHLLSFVAAIVPTWQIIPTKDIPTISFKEPWKCQLARISPRRNAAKPRAATAQEFMRVVKELESRLHEITIPFLVVHGELDIVCDPEGVKNLYEKASSSDKTLKIYEGMWHQLVGEPKENTDLVFSDVYSWLEERAEKACKG
eukprot:c23626_g1_i1 orf=184-1140(+)